MQNINWVLQSNLTRADTLHQIKSALELEDIPYEEVMAAPFSNEIPAISNPAANNFFYGTSSLIQNVYRNPALSGGVFYHSDQFNAQNYIQHWGTRMLNHDAEITTFGKLVKHEYDNQAELFIRPVNDDKSFSGKVMTFSEIKELEATLHDSNNPYLTGETLILVTKPKLIEKEWRHFIVNKTIVSSCRYLKQGRLDVSAADVPDDLLSFVRENCGQYTPHDIFVMDTALYKDDYYIVECNCFNDSGFYDHDIVSIFRHINRFLKNN